MRRGFCIFLCLTFLGVFLPPVQPLQATTLRYFNIRELLQLSHLVIEADVREIETIGTELQTVSTLITLDHITTLRGEFPEETLALVQRGGGINGEFLELQGSPHFVRGERVLLFILGNNSLMVPVLGWTQGLFRLRTDGLVTDHDGNLILGVDPDGNLIKEISASPTAHIVRLDGDVGHVQGGADIAVGAEHTVPVEKSDENARTPMTTAMFLTTLKELSAQMPKPTGNIVSYQADVWAQSQRPASAAIPPSPQEVH